MAKQKHVYGSVSKKCVYALRSVFELASRGNGRSVKVHEIAESQGIPLRFLEVILNQLSHGGFVESRRGKNGGYQLSREASAITVGEIISFLQGPGNVVVSDNINSYNRTTKNGDYAFGRIWENVAQAVAEIYDGTTLAEMVEQEKSMTKDHVLNYSI